MVQSNDNVVPFGDPARAKARLTPGESARELRACRELALERLARSLAEMLDSVEDELFELAGKSPDRGEREVYLDAREQARGKRALIESTFRQHFVEFFNRKVRGEPASAAEEPGAAAPDGARQPDSQASLAALEMSRKLSSACEAELGALSQRMGFLLERPGLQDDANPVSPATICAALTDACDQVESGLKVRMALLQRLEQHAQVELGRVYHDLNAHLVERRILPDVRPGPRGDVTQPLHPLPDATQPADHFALLVQLRRDGACGPPAPADAVLAELTRIQRDSARVSSGTLVNELRSLPARLLEGGHGSVDPVTLDLVAMLFDCLLEDRHQPARVKAQVGRLQVPVLKAVLLDAAFFSSRRQPARRLLDALAEVGIALTGDDAGARGALDLVGEVVQRLLAGFDADPAIFDAMAAMVETFLAANEEAEANQVQHAAAIVAMRERRQVARLAGAAEVRRRLQARTWVPAPLREMLLLAWSRAFAGVHAAEGEGTPAWQKLARTMDDLLWSVEPKVAPEDRKRLVAVLPAMLAEVAEALDRAQMPDRDRDAFLSVLVDCHALAVKAGLRGMAVVPEFPSAAAPSDEARLEREVIADGSVRLEEIRFESARGAAVALARTGAWMHVQRGTWVEFNRIEGPVKRARLSWVSPGKLSYLFTNPLTGAAALSVSPEALAEQMRRGEARMLNDAPLVGRALDSVSAALRDRKAAARSPSP